MANRIVWKFRDLADNHIVQVPYADNGDGTYTPVVSLAATPTIDIGDVSILGDDAATLLGSKTDAADTHTDATPITWTQVLKQFSKSIQALVTANHIDLTSVLAALTGGEPAITAITPITVSDSAAVTPGRFIKILCTVAGNVKIGVATGTTIIPVEVGLTILPFAVTKLYSTLTTAVATYEIWN